MNKKVKKFFAGLLSFVMVFAMTAAAAPAKETKAATEGTPYTGDMTVFLAMQGDVSGSWDMTWINGSSDVEGVVPTMVTNAKAGDTVTIGLSFPNEVVYTWWMAPVVVLNDENAGTVTTLDYTIDKITIDGQEVVPDLSLGNSDFWYEGTGDWTNTQSIRLKGGYNEWADHYIESPQNYQEIMYTITFGDVITGAEETDVPEESGNAPLIGGTAYAGDMTVFLAMQGDVSASGAWDMTWINGSSDVEGVVPTMATNVKAGDTVTIGLSFPEEVIYTWWMAPVVVLNDAEAGTVTTLDYTIDKVTIDGQEVVPDLSLGENAFWYEGTGDWTNTQSIRLKGGYNEWADHYIESPQNYQEVMYTITFGDVVTGQIAGTAYDGEVSMFLAGTAESADQAWDWTWANGSTDNAAITGNVVTAKAGDTVIIGITYPGEVHHTWWLAPTVVFPETEEEKGYKVDYTIDMLVIDGNDVTDQITLDAAADLSWYEGTENHPVTRTIRLGGGYNEWGAGNAKCVDGTLLEGFTTIEYTITLNYIYAEPVEEVAGPMVDKNGTYNAYLGIQSQNYTFRNAWDDGTYGLNSVDYPEAFGQMSIVETGVGAVKKAGTFYDTEIAGNGTYTLEVKDLAWDDGSVDLNLLFISTDIPNSGEITVSNVKVEFDGKQVMSFDEGFEDPDSKDYLKVLCINIWNKDLTAAKPMAENLPTSTAKITFEVSGFDYDKVGGEEVTPEPTEAPEPTTDPVEDPEPTTDPVEEPEPTEAPAGEPTTAPVSSDTNSETEGSSFSTVIVAIIVVAVIAVAGGVAFVVLKKKKTSGEE